MTRLPCHVIKAAMRAIPAEKPHKAAGPALIQRDPWLVESHDIPDLCKNRIQLLFIDLELDPGTDLTVYS